MIENGEIKKLRENVTGINYVAVDWIGGNVLYTVRRELEEEEEEGTV